MCSGRLHPGALAATCHATSRGVAHHRVAGTGRGVRGRCGRTTGRLSRRRGARVADAVGAAGGTTPDADLDPLNLAARLSDGDRVFVPRKGQTPPPVLGPGPAGDGSTSSGPVNLNTATPEQLEALSGVGPATAHAIITWRQQHGRFRSVQDLLQVRGIGPAKLEALHDQVTV